MQEALEEWFKEDVGKGDFTTLAVVPNSICKAQVTGESGIISGLEVCKLLLDKHNINFNFNYVDGDLIDSPLIMSLEGKAHDILAIERLLLNIISHLSGISTHTYEIVKRAKKINPDIEILATRKTVPGLRFLEKKAVVHGGGLTHRMRLDDALLVKDNHLKLSQSIEKAIKACRVKYPDLLLEVEADNEIQAIEVAKCGADRLMLDNFTPEEAKIVVSKIKKFSNIEIEISGGITLTNIEEYAPYADFISLSSLTMSSSPINFSLHVI